MTKLILLLFCSFFLYSCGSGNPTVRNDVKKRVDDSLTIGVEEYKKGNYDSAKIFLEQALKNAYSIDNGSDIINAMQNLGEISIKLENYSEASNYIFSAQKLAETEKIQTFNFIITLTIGKFYDKTASTSGEYKRALEYYQSAAAMTQKDEEKAVAYNSIGISEIRQGNLDEALVWIEKSRKINESKKIYNAIADNYFNIGEVYEKKGNWNIALTNYNIALQNDKISENSSGIIDDLKSIAQVYLNEGLTDNAILFYSRALNTASSIGNRKEAALIQGLINNLQVKNP